jgi:serine/threonine protein kinase
MSLASGHRLGPYEILGPLGSGGMGEVFRARDTRLDREVALKVLPQEVAQDPSRRERFEREAKAVAALNHPNIVAVHDIGEDQGVLYIVSELVPGQTLRGATYPLRKTLDIAAQIAEGLDAAHTAGVTHRDLKPENVMVTPEGRAKILDFGLAKRAAKTTVDSPTETVATGPGAVMGTVGYMSPEQVRGEEAGPRSDIFSFGALLYELLSGERAFKAKTAVETMHAILKADPPELAPSIPEGVRDLAGHCLEKNPAQRFQSARDLGFALRALSGRTATTTSQALPAIPGRPPGRWITAAALVLVLLLGIIGGGIAALRWVDSSDANGSPVRLSRFTSDLAEESYPAFSPDGKSVAYFRGATQKDIVVQGFDSSDPVTIAHSLIVSNSTLMWTADGTRVCFLFIEKRTFSCVSASGGTPQRLIENVNSAVFTPNGESLVLLRPVEGKGNQLFVSSPPGAPPQPVSGVTLPNGIQALDQISPDGRKLLLNHGEWLTSYPSGSPRTFITGGRTPTWLPDSRHVVFAVTPSEASSLLNFQVSIRDTESSAERVVLSDTGEIISLAISPDGKRVMYSTGQPEWHIVEFTGEGKRKGPVVASPLMEFEPEWSPQGDRFEYGVSSTGTQATHWTRATDGSSPQRLSGVAKDVFGLWYSPDGRRFAYTRSGNIETLSAAGGRPVRVYSGKAIDVCWAPDGETLWFSEGDTLRKISSQGGAATTVREIPELVILLACSPDGSVAYRNRRGIYVLSADGKQSRQMATTIQGNRASFAEGGKLLYVLRGRGTSIDVFDVASGALRGNVDFELNPADIVLTFSIHPDGKRILAMVGGLRSDLWMAEGFAQPAKGWKSWFRHWEVPEAPPSGP